MEPINLTAPAAASGSAPSVPGSGIVNLIFSFFNGETTSSFASGSGLLHFFDILWLVYTFLAFALSIVMLVLYAYASTRRWQFFALADKELRDAESKYDEMYRGVRKIDRMKDVFEHLESINPNDWKLAIIEADIILDDLLKQNGYAGNTLGERLKSISPHQMSSLSDAWEAHKVRNRIAHDGADFVLTKRLAEDTINRYRRVFAELGM